jgi:hypothetical protein
MEAAKTHGRDRDEEGLNDVRHQLACFIVRGCTGAIPDEFKCYLLEGF